jgi:hypothetical protein
MVSLEFAHYDVRRCGAISPSDFGLSLVACASVSDVSTFLSRVAALRAAEEKDKAAAAGKGKKAAAQGHITEAQFAAFHALMCVFAMRFLLFFCGLSLLCRTDFSIFPPGAPLPRRAGPAWASCARL